MRKQHILSLALFAGDEESQKEVLRSCVISLSPF